MRLSFCVNYVMPQNKILPKLTILKGNSGEGPLPHEILLMIQFHKRINGPVDLLLEENRVVPLIPPFQFRLGLIREVRGSQQPLVGAHGLVIDCGNKVSERTLAPTRCLSMSFIEGRK